MTAHPVTGPNLRANGERAQDFLSPRVLAREAAKVCADLDLRLPAVKVRRLVTLYVREGRTDLDFRSWFLAYADPTGETAVRHVMQERDR